MSLKLGNLAINKIYLGSTPINKVYLGSNQIFPNASAGGTPFVTESFESFSGGLPNTLDWSSTGFDTTVTQTMSNVTNGTFSCRLQVATDGLLSMQTTYQYDLSPYSTVQMDLFLNLQAANSGSVFQLVIENEAFESASDSVDLTLATGSNPLSVDISGISDKTHLRLKMSTNLVGADQLDVYVDYLRAS